MDKDLKDKDPTVIMVYVLTKLVASGVVEPKTVSREDFIRANLAQFQVPEKGVAQLKPEEALQLYKKLSTELTIADASLRKIAIDLVTQLQKQETDKRALETKKTELTPKLIGLGLPPIFAGRLVEEAARIGKLDALEGLPAQYTTLASSPKPEEFTVGVQGPKGLPVGDYAHPFPIGGTPGTFAMRFQMKCQVGTVGDGGKTASGLVVYGANIGKVATHKDLRIQNSPFNVQYFSPGNSVEFYLGGTHTTVADPSKPVEVFVIFDDRGAAGKSASYTAFAMVGDKVISDSGTCPYVGNDKSLKVNSGVGYTTGGGSGLPLTATVIWPPAEK